MKRKFFEILKRSAAAAIAASLFLTSTPVEATGGTLDPAATEETGDEGAVDVSSESKKPHDYDYTKPWVIQGVTGDTAPTLTAKTGGDFSKNYDSTGVEAEKNLYTLTISTGASAGTKGVRYIAVVYTDTTGMKQTEYILMTDDPIKKSYEYIKKKAGENEELKARHDKLSSLNYTVGDIKSSTPLEAWSTDEYLFKTESEIASINDIHILMRGGNSWTIQGLVCSKVSRIYGFGEYGFYSGRYFAALGKVPIAALKKKGSSLTLSPASGADMRYKLSSNPYFEMEQMKEAKETATPFKDLYTFRVDFADTLEGGIESYLSETLFDGKKAPADFMEHLALEIEYKDSDNWTHRVTLPVMLSAYGQYLCSEDNIRTIGLGQRGETVAFTGCLPGFKSLLTSKLYVGKKAREKLSSEGDISAKSSSMQSTIDRDKIGLAGVSFYTGTCRISNTADGTDAVTGEKLKSYTTAYSFSSAAPSLYYTISKEGGVTISPNTVNRLHMQSYKAGNPIVASAYDKNVVVRLKTYKDSPLSGTTGNLRFRLTYESTANTTKTTSYVNVKKQTDEYLGYWPSAAGVDKSFGYSYGMYSGNYVEFMLDISDLWQVTDVDVSMADTDDEYVLGGMSVLVCDDVGRRRIYAQNVTGYGDSSSVRIVRSYESGAMKGFPFDLVQSRLIAGGEEYNYAINKGDDTGSSITAKETDEYQDLRYSLSHDDTTKNLGFAKSRQNYEVAVKVAEESETAGENGDAGSVNKFYFQLQFRTGNSGIVLANQQMFSDGFRAGYTEVFYISVNHNYGAVRSINIIPEDVQSDNEVFDKLNIESITVTEDNGGGVANQYIFEDVGWIGIDYHDEGEAASIRGQSGRSLGDLASRFRMSHQRKVINLACDITTLPGSLQIQPEASVACELAYIDTEGQPQTVSFDVVNRMASYMKKKARSYEGATNGSDAKYYANMTTISDPEWMLRPAHTDRFIFPSIADLKSITAMKLVAVNRGEGTAEWVIGNISISQIVEDGPLTLTADNELVRAMQTSSVCRSVMDRDYETLTLTAGTAQSIDFSFTENTITYPEEDSSIAIPVSRLPDSTADTINIYVYPTESTLRKVDIGNKNITVTAQYATEFSKGMQISDKVTNVYGRNTINARYYTRGLKVDGMTRLMNLGIRCLDNKIAFDHAVVQHYRENVLISSYYIPFMGASATMGVTNVPAPSDTVNDRKLQNLTLSLGLDTPDSTLFDMENDMAFAIRYTSTLDEASGDDGEKPEYWSPYIYLTDLGYTNVHGGMLAEIPFEVPFADEVTGISIGQYGGISAVIDGAQVVCYTYDKKATDPDTGEIVLVNKTIEKFEKGKDKNGFDKTGRDKVYSFNETATLDLGTRTFEYSAIGTEEDNTLNLVDLTFFTKDVAELDESGTNDPVEMVFYYLNEAKAIEYKHITDIRPYIQAEDQNFTTANSAQIRLFLPNCKDMVAILIVPYDMTERTATWSVDKVTGFMSLGAKPLNRAVNRQFTEMTKDMITFMDGTYDLPDVSVAGTGVLLQEDMGTTTFDYGLPGGRRFGGSVSEHKATIDLYPGEDIAFYPSFEQGGTYTARASILSTYTPAGSSTKERTGFLNYTSGLTDENGVVTLTPQRSDEIQTYKVIITSTANSDTKDIIDITVRNEGEREGSSDVITLTTAYDHGVNDKDRVSGVITDNRLDISISEMETINFKPTITGSDAGYSVIATKTTDKGQTSMASAITDKTDEGFTFTPDAVGSYVITIRTDDPTVRDVINITCVEHEELTTTMRYNNSQKTETSTLVSSWQDTKNVEMVNWDTLTFSTKLEGASSDISVVTERQEGSEWKEDTTAVSENNGEWTLTPEMTTATLQYRVTIKPNDDSKISQQYNITVKGAESWTNLVSYYVHGRGRYTERHVIRRLSHGVEVQEIVNKTSAAEDYNSFYIYPGTRIVGTDGDYYATCKELRYLTGVVEESKETDEIKNINGVLALEKKKVKADNSTYWTIGWVVDIYHDGKKTQTLYLKMHD